MIFSDVSLDIAPENLSSFINFLTNINSCLVFLG